MNRLNKTILMMVLVALVGTNDAVAEGRFQALNNRMKKFSRNARIFVDSLRSKKQCDKQVVTDLKQDAKAFGAIVAVALITTGAVVGGREIVRSINTLVPHNYDFTVGSDEGLGIVLNEGVIAKQAEEKAALEREQERLAALKKEQDRLRLVALQEEKKRQYANPPVTPAENLLAGFNLFGVFGFN